MKIKIKELNEIRYTGIEDSDLFLVETSADTYKMTVGDAKALFSADEKINALGESLTTTISDYKESTDTKIENLSTKVEEISTSIGNNNTNLTNVTKRVLVLEEDMVEAKSNISSNTEDIESLKDKVSNHDKLLENHEFHLSEIDTEISNIKTDIKNLQTAVSKNTSDIEEINTTIKDIQQQIEQMGINTSEDLSEKVKELTELVNQKYTELEQQIDYWHHTTEDTGYVKI